jgi:hypothetical protein
MQRIGGLLVALGMAAGTAAAAQQSVGAALWRVAGTTLAVPFALVTGPTGTFWNPAQDDDSTRTQIGLEAVQTPAVIGASAVLGVVRTRVRPIGHIGVVFGHVGLADIARTTDSPDPLGGMIPVYASAIGATWSRRFGVTDVGATLAIHESRLDALQSTRGTFDIGVSREIAQRLRIAAATHFFSSLRTSDPAQDLYAGLEYRLWHGALWGDRGVVRTRYGIAFGHGFAADHQLGLGFEVGRVVALDGMIVREGGYDDHGWRGTGALRVTIGKYRISFARDAGTNEIGSGYRVGVDARFK